MADTSTKLDEVAIDQPSVGWADVGGQDDATTRLREGAELPLRNPQVFKRLGIRPAKGFLLYGPPGTGKALLASALAKEARAGLITVRGADLLSMFKGESAERLSRIFTKARDSAPCVIFIDEIDGMVPARGTAGLAEQSVTLRLTSTLIAALDALEPDRRVVVIGATSRPAALDPAVMRPGRLDELIYVGTPDGKGRAHIIKRLTAAIPLAKDVDLAAVASECERFTAADLDDLVRRAGLSALRRGGDSVKSITKADFATALAESRATVTADMEAEYTKMKGDLKKQMAASTPVGFLAPGMVEPVRDKKH